MNIDQLEKLLVGKTPQQVMEVVKLVNNPVGMITTGLDLTNITADTIPGAVRFGIWSSVEDKYNPEKYAAGYVTWVNGPMNPMYTFTEEDFSKLATQHPPEAIIGLRNQRLITR